MKCLSALVLSAAATSAVGSKSINDWRIEEMGTRSVCGSKPMWEEAVCFKGSSDVPEAYQRAQPVARLSVGCTAWLVGCDGYILTNNHCISSSSGAKSAKFEFGAECDVCQKHRESREPECPGTFTVSDAELIATDENLDYTLLKAPSSTLSQLSKFGYTAVRESGPVVGEEIYIAQHPARYPKQISRKLESGKIATILSTTTRGSCGGYVTYKADTTGGSSGSPVFSAVDNKVVALHHCGGCKGDGNSANNMASIVKDLRNKGVTVPSCWFGGNNPTPYPTKSTPYPTTSSPFPTTSTPPVGCGSCKGCLYEPTNACFNWGSSLCDRFGSNFKWCGKN